MIMVYAKRLGPRAYSLELRPQESMLSDAGKATYHSSTRSKSRFLRLDKTICILAGLQEVICPLFSLCYWLINRCQVSRK